jgi:hypothetical protein
MLAGAASTAILIAIAPSAAPGQADAFRRPPAAGVMLAVTIGTLASAFLEGAPP